MKTLDRLDHEEARQALALFSQMEAAATPPPPLIFVPLGARLPVGAYDLRLFHLCGGLTRLRLARA